MARTCSTAWSAATNSRSPPSKRTSNISTSSCVWLPAAPRHRSRSRHLPPSCRSREMHAKHVKANGKVDLWHLTEDGWAQVELWAADAAHALRTDPKHWAVEK